MTRRPSTPGLGRLHAGRPRLYVDNVWEPLTTGVPWTGLPLLAARASGKELVDRLGAAHATDLDSNGLGPVDAWALRFPCGLEVAVWLFRQRPDGSRIEEPNESAHVEIYAKDRDIEHVRFHLPISTTDNPWESKESLSGRRAWGLLRQDDNGNLYAVREFTSQREAEAAAASFEAHGHKQMYWVERLAVRAS